MEEMTQGERVYTIRKELDLTLEKFGKKVGVGKTQISRIEKGERGITDQMAKTICTEFNVNYDYLMYGEGEMFSDLPKTVFEELCVQYECTEFEREALQCYLSFDKEIRKKIEEHIRKTFKIK